MRIGSLASGYGGLDMGVQAVLGGEVAWHCEYDTAPSKVLAHHWPDVPNLGDITAIDWTEVEPVDVLVGGYPCQPFSHAGKRRGIEDERHIWPWIADAIRVLRPRLLVFENVAGHLRLGFDTVLADLAAMGAYDVRWGLVRASDTGAPHRRERLWIVAQVADADLAGLEGRPAVGRGPDQRPAGPGGVGAVALLPTATASMATGAGTSGRDGGPNLQTAVGSLLPTPKASDGPNGGPGMRNGRGEAAQGESRNHTIYVRDAPQQNLENALAFTLDQHDHQSALDDCGCMAWGPYAPALHRWEQIQGRPAPAPTELSATGRRVLSPLAVEFMMGLPLRHVTDPAIGLTRAQQLKALGNGVVPQQAALALRLLGLGYP